MRNTKSKYAQMFDSTCKDWEKDRRYNLMYLKAQEYYFNEVLRARHYVFLRDILEYLGLPVTKASLFVGWYFDLNDPSGDN